MIAWKPAPEVGEHPGPPFRFPLAHAARGTGSPAGCGPAAQALPMARFAGSRSVPGGRES